MVDGDINLIDSRLDNIKTVLEEAVNIHGSEILTVTTDVDIKTITGLCGYDGNKKSRKYLEFLNSENEGQVESVDASGDRTEAPIFLNREISNGLVRASEGRVGTADEMVKSIDRMKEQLNNYFTGGGNPMAKAINAAELAKVRQFMGVMNEVFGFNSAEQLEMFIAAWLAPDTTTRLSGIPGTGKTTLIECASLMFGNSYGFVSGKNEENSQVWNSLRSEAETREWEDRRFKEQAYRYPFIYLLRDIYIPSQFVSPQDEGKTNFTLGEYKSRSKEFIGGDYGIGGKLVNDYFNVAQKALRNDRIILFADDTGIIPNVNGQTVKDQTEYTTSNGWFRHPPLTEQEMASGVEYAYYQGITLNDFKELYSDYKKAYDAAEKGENGVPTSVGKNDAEALEKALLYYNNQTVVESIRNMVKQFEAGKRTARRFIAKIYYDSRADKEAGIKRIDSEMRKEIGIAKVDKDKRAEQILYGVDITAHERGKKGEGLTQYEFTPYPREIVTQPIKFFNEVNRSQASVEDAILGLIAEKEVEYRGQVFTSPNFTAFMDTNPHVGGNDLAFTDRIDMELMFPSALLDQRYKILKAGLSEEAQARAGLEEYEKPTPRRRVLRKILDGEITPLRFEELKKIWKDTNAVSYETSGYNALMDISIVSVLFAQRYGVHEPDAEISLDFAVPFKEGDANMISHQRNTGIYADSLKPLNTSGYFIDASISESKAYRNDLSKSIQAISRGHGAMALMDRVLAFRFTNSLAKLSRALAYLRGNAYVTRKEIMDVLPYVVGHRLGRSKGDGGMMEFGIKDAAATQFASGQDFVREAIVSGYLQRDIDSFGSTSMGNTGTWVQSRWVEWDSIVAQARKDLASARTYAEYEIKMWAMAKMASGDGNPATQSGTGDPMPYLIYKLVLMEEMAATNPNKMLHPFINPESEERTLEVYDKRIEYYQSKISDFLVAPAPPNPENYSAADAAILRRKIALERWLSIDNKLPLLHQVDSILDGITGSQIPDDFGPPKPSGTRVAADGTVEEITSGNLKLWGLYGACTDRLPDEYREIGMTDIRTYLGFPVNEYIRTHTWYGGSNTGRASEILYQGNEDSLTQDAYGGIKDATGAGDTPMTEGTAIYPTASKTHTQQSIVLRGSVQTDDGVQDMKDKLENLLNEIDQTYEVFAVCELDTGGTGTPKEMGITEFIGVLSDLVLDVNTSDNEVEHVENYVSELGNIEREFDNPVRDLDMWDKTGLKILGTDEDRLRLYITFIGDNGNKYVEFNFCLASAFVHLTDESNLEIISITDTDPLGGAANLSETYINQNTFFDLGNMTLYAALSFDQLAKKYA